MHEKSRQKKGKEGLKEVCSKLGQILWHLKNQIKMASEKLFISKKSQLTPQRRLEKVFKKAWFPPFQTESYLLVGIISSVKENSSENYFFSRKSHLTLLWEKLFHSLSEIHFSFCLMKFLFFDSEFNLKPPCDMQIKLKLDAQSDQNQKFSLKE